MRKSLRAPLLAAFASACWLIACAADPGDAVKTGGGIGNTSTVGNVSVSTSSSTQDGTQNYSGTNPGTSQQNTNTTGSVVATTSSTMATSSTPFGPSSSSASGMSSSSSSSSVAVGAGCAAGATVLMASAAINSGHSGAFGVTGPVCVQWAGNIPQAWGCSSCDGRMVTVVGSTTTGPTAVTGTMAGALSPGMDGNIYFNFTAGMYTYAQMYAY